MTDTTTREEQTRSADHGAVYDAAALQEKWLPVWDELAPFRAGRPGDSRPRMYMLDMFPYPSGDLHMGHAEAYALGDVIARFWVQRGYDVLHPIGWDSFGLPAENAAIKRGDDPRGVDLREHRAAEGVHAPVRLLVRLGPAAVHLPTPSTTAGTSGCSCSLYERGLAYRKPSMVNWCPHDQTVLANEQVVDGRCERCDTLVTKKKLTQWYFRITDYADRLLDDMEQLRGALAREGPDDAAQLDRPVARAPTSGSPSRAATSR